LEGSVQKAGDQVRVNVQLIDAKSDAHLWAEKYDRKLTDIFAVESDIAASIAEALQAKLTRAERRAISSRPTVNSEAYQLYLKGRYHWRNFFAPGYEKVLDYFQAAVELDPSYAPAYAGLGLYHSFGAANGILRPEQNWPLAQTAVEKALTTDETLAEAYNPLAAVELYYKRNWPAAERASQRGAELDPNFGDIPHHYGFCLALFGRNQEALAEMDRAAQLDPFFPGLNLHRARLYFFFRDYDHAINQFTRTLELHPGYAAAHEYFGDACEKKGMETEAITQWSLALSLSGEAEHAAILHQTYVRSGFEAAVRALAEQKLECLDEQSNQGQYVPAADYLKAYTRLGAKEQALAWLEKTVEERNWFALETRINPIYDPLRGDPRFAAAVEKLFGKT
jgi:tetratricopeptide (TPR) repeat protein